jgi:hypothetical protein
VLDAAASNISGFLWRATCVSSTLFNMPIWNKMKLYPGRKFLFAGGIPLKKLTQFLWGNKALDAPAFNTDGFLSRDTYVSSTKLDRPIRNKMSLSPPSKL